MNRGPNVTKLIFQFMGREAIPPGGGIADAIDFFKNSEKRRVIMAKAEADTFIAIQAIKSAPDNPYGDDDEAIAAVILEKIAERKNERSHNNIR